LWRNLRARQEWVHGGRIASYPTPLLKGESWKITDKGKCTIKKYSLYDLKDASTSLRCNRHEKRVGVIKEEAIEGGKSQSLPAESGSGSGIVQGIWQASIFVSFSAMEKEKSQFQLKIKNLLNQYRLKN